MDINQTTPPLSQEKKSSKMIWFVLALFVMIVVIIWLLLPQSTKQPTVNSGEDTTSAITSELEKIDVGDIDVQMKSIDEDLKNL